MRSLTPFIAPVRARAVAARAGAQPREEWDERVVSLHFRTISLDGDPSAGPATSSDQWTRLARGDIRAGGADPTWSGSWGFENRVARRGRLEVGFKAPGRDVSSDDRVVREYDVTHYSPIVGLRLPWRQ